MQFVDFHSHMLCGIDDGSSSVEQSLAMIETSAAQGAEHIVLSPHFYAKNDDPESFINRRNRRFERLCQALPKNAPQLHLGAEVAYFEGMTQVDALKDMRIGASKCLLVEMPFSEWTGRILSDIYSLNRKKDFQVVLAHFERYLSFVPMRTIDEIISNGVILQSNAECFEKLMSRRRFLKLFRNGYIGVIGSDAHNMSDRAPNVGKALDYISKKCGEESVWKMYEFSKRLLAEDAV